MTDVGEKPHDSLRIEKPSAHCQLAPLCAETRIHWEWIDRRVRKSASIANGSVRAAGKSGSIANGTPKPEPDPRSSWNGTGSPDRNSESIANGSPNPSWISPSIANGSQNPSPVADPFPMEAPNRTRSRSFSAVSVASLLRIASMRPCSSSFRCRTTAAFASA